MTTNDTDNSLGLTTYLFNLKLSRLVPVLAAAGPDPHQVSLTTPYSKNTPER